jgi:hypothetical protein
MCTAYAAALSVSGLPGLRWLLEVVTVSTLFWLGVPFLGFALAYTGRREALGSWWFKLLLAAETATALVLLTSSTRLKPVGFRLATPVTNPYHHLFWSAFQVQAVFGATGAVYDFGPWAFVAAAINTVTVGAGTGL